MDMIYEREDELFLAAADFLGTVLCVDDEKDAVTAIQEYGIDIGMFVDSVFEYLAADFNVSAYRPTMCDGAESGEELLDEYPYDYLVDGDDSDEEPAADSEK